MSQSDNEKVTKVLKDCRFGSAQIAIFGFDWKTIPALDIHCVQKKTPTHIFFHICMNCVWI